MKILILQINYHIQCMLVKIVYSLIQLFQVPLQKFGNVIRIVKKNKMKELKKVILKHANS